MGLGVDVVSAGQYWSATLKVNMFASITKKEWTNEIPVKLPFDDPEADPEDDNADGKIKHQEVAKNTKETDFRNLGGTHLRHSVVPLFHSTAHR